MARDNLIRQNMHAFGQSATRPDPRVNRIMHFLEKNHARIVGREELASMEGVSARLSGKTLQDCDGYYHTRLHQQDSGAQVHGDAQATGASHA